MDRVPTNSGRFLLRNEGCPPSLFKLDNFLVLYGKRKWLRENMWVSKVKYQYLYMRHEGTKLIFFCNTSVILLVKMTRYFFCFKFFSHDNSVGIYRGNIYVRKTPRKFTDENIPSVFLFVFINFLVVNVHLQPWGAVQLIKSWVYFLIITSLSLFRITGKINDLFKVFSKYS